MKGYDNFEWVDFVVADCTYSKLENYYAQAFPSPMDAAAGAIVQAHLCGWQPTPDHLSDGILVETTHWFTRRLIQNALRTGSSFIFFQAVAALDFALRHPAEDYLDRKNMALIFDLYYRVFQNSLVDTQLKRFPTFWEHWIQFENEWRQTYDDSPREMSLRRFGYEVITTDEGPEYCQVT